MQITIIGLGRTGTSLGLALKHKKLEAKIVGHDLHLEIAKQAERAGALDKAEWNLPNACESAEVIFLCVPFVALHEVLTQIAPALQNQAVVVAFAVLQTPVLQWINEILPAGRSYVGVAPALNPKELQGVTAEARATLFADGLWALVASAAASPEAVKLVGGFAGAVGATPLFISADEYDALSTSVNLLPALSAVSLMLAASQGSGWTDARKVADRSFATVTTPLNLFSAESLAEMLANNRANMLHELDALLAQLKILREALASSDAETLRTLLQTAVEARETWLSKRLAANWIAEEVTRPSMPKMGDFFAQLTGIGKPKLNDK